MALPAERFRAILGDERVLDHPLERTVYSRDGSIAEGDCGLVVLPETTAEIVACINAARELGVAVVPRGSGTGLTGAAVPLDGAVVLSTARMTRIRKIDESVPCAWVEPGVLNLDISTAVRDRGLHYAPDPSSQAACSIGGNVATNSGGPHCLSAGVTSQHVLGLELVTPEGEVLRLGGVAPDPPGLDLRGFVVGGEGTLGVVSEVCVRLTRDPEHVRTMLLDFPSIAAGAETVGGIIAAGVVPAAMEMMDQGMNRAVEDFVGAGLPTEAATVLLVEVDGTAADVAAQSEVVERVGRENGVGTVRVAADDAERELLWKARKSAFGAMARIAPNYYLHDCVVPRTHLVEVLDEVAATAARHDLVILNVFHAGDGNLHPLIAFDRRDPEQVERVHAAGGEIIRAAVAVGGVLSGEHGIGLEKRDFMELTFTAVDLEAQACARAAFDPHGMMNPAKVLPAGSRCGDIGAASAPEGTWI